MTVLRISALEDAPFVVVECGARGSRPDARLVQAFPHVRLVGFEPEPVECQRLSETSSETHSFYPVAIGRRRETRTLHVTNNPQCSSLLEPNVEFLGSFLEFPTSFEVQRAAEVATVDLDTYLPEAGVTQVDFLQLDVQGAELDVLQGCRSFLESTILGIRCEVEFAPMYVGQPLFADVDAYIRSLGFVLFDVSRWRYRRSALPPVIDTRGQLLWGDALYLRDYKHLVQQAEGLQALKLAVVASVHGFHDYAAEILDALVAEPVGALDAQMRSELQTAKARYYTDLRPGWLPHRAMRWIATSRLFPRTERTMWPFRRIGHNLKTGYRLANTHWAD